MERIIYSETFSADHQEDYYSWVCKFIDKVPDEHQDTTFIRFKTNVNRTVLVTVGYSA